MKINCGDMYLQPMGHPLYAWSVSRVWWRPWRYNLHLHTTGMYDPKPIRNLTKDGLIGTLKLMELWKD